MRLRIVVGLGLVLGLGMLSAERGLGERALAGGPAGGLAGGLAGADRPNILVIMPDDVGYWNVGAYSHGMMVPTPNIDRIARQGMLFTDHYSQPT